MSFFKSEGQAGKTGPVWGDWYSGRRRGLKGRGEDGEYGNIIYSCMKTKK
jgi:hypothetical protein